MVPKLEQKVIVVAEFCREDLVRLHTLLACYQSAYRTTDEALACEADRAAHEELRRYVRALLG